jgi:hypothetical protein
MPGLGRKTFTAGDILTAAQVQGLFARSSNNGFCF